MHKTGATRYQKFLKAEKAKTKLKGKKDKELPKGTNVTKTNFKVKKIVIKEQLKKHVQSEALTTRKLNVKELISRLNHFNTNARTDALEGLKELITSHPDVLESNLGQLLNSVTTLVLNIEKVVRQGALKVLHLMLSNVSPEKIEPFFDIMSTYLRSAMTHIDSRIQEDSLFFLDILLLCAPSKVAHDFHKIIPNFLDMISKLRVDSKPGRTLTVNLNSQITTVKWRVKVFQRLQEFLQKYALYYIDNNEDQELNKNLHMVNTNIMNYYPLLDPIYTSNCHLLCYSAKVSDNEQQIDEADKFKEYIATLVPLLFETWLEASPNAKSHANFEMVINEENALLLKHILGNITLLGSLVKYFDRTCPSSNIKKIFIQKSSGPFSQHFVSSFPYVTNIRSKQTSSEERILDPKLVAENLEICNIFIMFTDISMKYQEKEINAVVSYIEKVFHKNTGSNLNEKVIKIFDLLFSNEQSGWNQNTGILDNLFKSILQAYASKIDDETLKQKVFTLLCKIALNEKLSHLHLNDDFKSWLQNLPDILLGKQLTVQTIDILHKFAITNNTLFNKVMKSKLFEIIKNLPCINIIDCTVDTNSYHKLLSLFYWIKAWDTESLNLLESQLMDNVYKPDHVKYIFDTLRLKSGGLI